MNIISLFSGCGGLDVDSKKGEGGIPLPTSSTRQYGKTFKDPAPKQAY